MAYSEVFEESKLKLKAKIKRGPKGAAPKCTFKFTVSDGTSESDVADQPGKVSGEFATCEIKVPKVKDPETIAEDTPETYVLQFEVIDDDDSSKYPGTETYRIWPRNVQVTLKQEEDGAEKDFPGLEFTLTQKDAKAVNGVMPKPEKLPFDRKRDKPGPVTVEPDANYKVKTWKKGLAGNGRVREAVVENSFPAEFHSPESGKEIEQAINHDSTVGGADGKGHIVLVTVGAKGDKGKATAADRTATPSADIFIKATFSLDTGRNSPKVGLLAADGFKLIDHKVPADRKVQTASVKVSADKIAQFKVELGLGGGEKCKIEIGTVKDRTDDTLEFVNWRLLEYELWQPRAQDPNKMTDYTNFKGPATAGLATASTDFFKKTLDPLFIKFTEKAAKFLSKPNLPENGDHNIIDAEYVRKDAGKKILILELDQAKAVLDTVAAHGTDPRIITMIWCDYLCDPKAWNASFVVETDGEEFTVNSAPNSWLRVFENAVCPANGIAHGAYSISKISWKVKDYQKDDGTWAAPTSGKPGYDFRSATAITDKDGIKAHITFVKFDTIKISLPATDDAYPGKKLTIDGSKQPTDKGKRVRLSVQIQGAAADVGMNGAAQYGTVWMNTRAGNVHPIGMGRTVLHELGHNMGMAYGSKANLPVYGAPEANKIPGIPFPTPVPTGFVYEGKGHVGPHCAHGLSAATRGLANYQNSEDAFKERDCIMFGSGNMALSTEFTFCEHCSKHIKGQNLASIRKNWYS